MLEFIEKMVDAERLVEGVDYEIVSFDLMDDDFESYSMDEWYNIDSLHYFQTEQINRNHFEEITNYVKKREPSPLSISPTWRKENKIFYLPTVKIDVKSTILFGLGVVQILKGEHAGQFLLYNFMRMNEPNLIEEDFLDELLMLKLYFQYTNQVGYYDAGVEHLLEHNWDHAALLFYSRREQVRERFVEIFRRSSRGMN